MIRQPSHRKRRFSVQFRWCLSIDSEIEWTHADASDSLKYPTLHCSRILAAISRYRTVIIQGHFASKFRKSIDAQVRFRYYVLSGKRCVTRQAIACLICNPRTSDRSCTLLCIAHPTEIAVPRYELSSAKNIPIANDCTYLMQPR